MIAISLLQLHLLGIVVFETQYFEANDICNLPTYSCVSIAHDSFAVFGATCALPERCGSELNEIKLPSDLFSSYRLCTRHPKPHSRDYVRLRISGNLTYLLNLAHSTTHIPYNIYLVRDTVTNNYYSAYYEELCVKPFKICDFVLSDKVFKYTDVPLSVLRFQRDVPLTTVISRFPYYLSQKNGSLISQVSRAFKVYHPYFVTAPDHDFLSFIPCVFHRTFSVSFDYFGRFLVANYFDQNPEHSFSFECKYFLCTLQHFYGNVSRETQLVRAPLVITLSMVTDNSTIFFGFTFSYSSDPEQVVRFDVSDIRVSSMTIIGYTKRKFDYRRPVKICGLYEIETFTHSTSSYTYNSTHYLIDNQFRKLDKNYDCAQSVPVVNDFAGFLAGLRQIFHLITSIILTVLDVTVNFVANLFGSIEDFVDELLFFVTRVVIRIFQTINTYLFLHSNLFPYILIHASMYLYTSNNFVSFVFAFVLYLFSYIF